MLRWRSVEDLLAEPPVRRFVHVAILTALRDGAHRLEFRGGTAGYALYYRLGERDWELAPPPEEIEPLLKPTLREVSRLVRPERPEMVILAGTPQARFEPLETGWLTYEIDGRWIDLRIYIDPREPFGLIRLDWEEAEEFAPLAASALMAYAEYLARAGDRTADGTAATTWPAADGSGHDVQAAEGALGIEGGGSTQGVVGSEVPLGVEGADGSPDADGPPKEAAR